MIFLGKTMVMSRGQSSTLIGEIFAEVDGEFVPYVMQVNPRNPHLLIQVRNSPLCEKEKGTIYNYFLPAETFILQAYNQRPTYIDKSELAVNENTLYYTLEHGDRRYWYFNGKSVKEYKCQFKKMFLTNDTKRWRQQTWYYSISLVGGTLMVEYLQGIYDDIYGKPTLSSDECTLWTKDKINGYKDKLWLYNEICKVKPEFANTCNISDYFSGMYELDKLDGDNKLIIS